LPEGRDILGQVPHLSEKPDLSKLGGIHRLNGKKYFGEMLKGITLLFVREWVKVRLEVQPTL
jgi:hypothetical protein